MFQRRSLNGHIDIEDTKISELVVVELGPKPNSRSEIGYYGLKFGDFKELYQGKGLNHMTKTYLGRV